MSPQKKFLIRSHILQSSIYLGFIIILLRLFYWQIIKGDELNEIATRQYERLDISEASRGSIFTSDGYLLVGNQPVYRLFAEKNLLENNPKQISQLLTPLILTNDRPYKLASQAAKKEIIEENTKKNIKEKLEKTEKNWIGLRHNISEELKQEIENLQIKGLGFDKYEKRFYPEASLAAHVTGFVGKNKIGEDLGYFGIEGALNNELKPYSRKHTSLTDALGLKLLFKSNSNSSAIDGRDVSTTINRNVQVLIEEELKAAVLRYEAKSGEVIVMDPKSGKILGMASFPSYDQELFYKYDTSLYKNPSLSENYEPGSTFKAITIAAGIDSKAIKENSKCDSCDKARKIGKYTIKTWNDEYHPDIDMKEALAISDNTAMIFAAEKIGTEKFLKYIKNFGIGNEIGIDLQEDSGTPFSDKWGPVELATRSFGQGIVINSMQLVRAIASIANDGKMMKPQIIEKVLDKKNNQEILVEPKKVMQVISKESAHTVKKMLAYTVEKSLPSLAKKRSYSVAGKTGTSQIANDSGGYKEDGTIASFIAFSPVDKPKFIMLVKLNEPSTSPWGAETAAPLWFKIADKLQLLL
ncbi:MAG: penicillin-binding protein 2 [Patescibacteria group bacterium]